MKDAVATMGNILPDGPVLGLRMTKRNARIRCMDCRRDTGARGLKEYPLMIRDDLWLSITADTNGTGVLCRADIERRLGRPLTEADLHPGP